MPERPYRPFSELRDTGLLWLINTTVFHPRGFALSVQVEEDGTVSGWALHGNGAEAWVFDEAAAVEDLQKVIRTFAEYTGEVSDA